MTGIAGELPLDGRPVAALSGCGARVWFDGRLDNREELAARCSIALVSSTDLVAAAYERFGEAFACFLNGDFALALFDPRRRRIVLARDVMGTRRLYYSVRPHLLLFASDIASILEHPGVTARPDEDGLADLLLEGVTDGHRTCFRGIQSVPPGHYVVADRLGVRVRRHWEFDPTRTIHFRAWTDYVDAFRSLFADAVRRRLDGPRPTAVSVSGGLDSTSIYCQAARLRGNGTAAGGVFGASMTFDRGTPADEQHFLDAIDEGGGERRGTAIARLPFSRLRILEDAAEVIRHQEAPHLPWNAQHRLLNCARRAGCRVILDGLFGDHLLAGQGYLVDLFHRGRWMAVRRDLRETAAWMTDVDPAWFRRAFRADLARSVVPRWLRRPVRRALAIPRSRREYPRWYSAPLVERARDRALARREPPREFASRHAEQIYQMAGSARFLAQQERRSRSGSMCDVEVRYPFRDRDLIAFVMAIPGDVVNAGGVPKGLLRHAMKGMLPEPIRLRRWKADFTALTNQAVLGDLDDILGLLTPTCLAAQAGWVDAPILARELTAMRTRLVGGDDGRAGLQASDAAALEIWLRSFFDPYRRAVSQPTVQLASPTAAGVPMPR
jgi:asparagine synthase (glutamine-hydrolysing)